MSNGAPAPTPESDHLGAGSAPSPLRAGNKPGPGAPSDSRQRTGGSAPYGAWVFRAIILVAVLGSVAVILWSLFVLLFPRLRQSRELSSAVARLSAAVDGLEQEWTEAEAAQVRNRRRQVDFELFGGRDALEVWLARLKEESEPLGLAVRGDFGPVSTRLAGTRMLTVVPVMVRVEVQPAGLEARTASPYQRILQLSQRLTSGEKRADLTELTVIGGTNSISRAVLVLNYWADEGGKP